MRRYRTVPVRTRFLLTKQHVARQPGAEVAPHRGRSARRRRIERLWVAGALAYSVVRITIVQTFLARYGVNVWLYAAVDLGSTVPYAIGAARTVGAMVDGDRGAALRWGLLAAVAFVAPDVTIVLTSDQMPWTIYVVLALVVSALGTVAVLRLRGEYRRKRRAVVDAAYAPAVARASAPTSTSR